MDGRFWIDGWTDVLRPTAQGVWCDQRGNIHHPKASTQVAGLGLSGYVPVTSEPPPGQNWNPPYIGSERCKENERF